MGTPRGADAGPRRPPPVTRDGRGRLRTAPIGIDRSGELPARPGPWSVDVGAPSDGPAARRDTDMNYPLDPNELLRLRTLDELKAGQRIPDRTVDRITAHAIDRFRVPVCLVTLIEADRQLIVSRQG